MTADDQIDGARAAVLEADDTGERVGRIAAGHRHHHAGIGERRPQPRVEARVGERQEVYVVRRTGDAVCGHRGGADHRVPGAGAIEDRDDAVEQATRSRGRDMRWAGEWSGGAVRAAESPSAGRGHG